MDDSITSNTSPDDRGKFERLLDAMPRIAEAVNAFSSEENQRAALDALVQAIGIPAGSAESADPAASARMSRLAPSSAAETSSASTSGGTADRDGGEENPNDGGDKPTAASAKTGGRRRRPARKWEPVRDINFRPEGKKALKEIVKEKQPTTIDQKNVLSVWWLEQVAEIGGIGVGHVLAAYKECDWREPAVPDNALQVTASRESWIDTKNMKAITTTPSGRNVVQYDMPIKKPGQKS